MYQILSFMSFRLNTGFQFTHSFVGFVSIKCVVPWQNGHACFLRVFWSHNSVIMIPWISHPLTANFELNDLHNKMLTQEQMKIISPCIFLLFVLASLTVIEVMIVITNRAVSRLTPGMSSSVGRKIPAAPWLVVSLKNLSANTVTTAPGIVC